MERKQIILDIPSGYKPELTEQEDSYLLQFFEPKEELEDILRVPESIGIYQTNSCNHGDGLFINFNKKQFLGVHINNYVVDAPLICESHYRPARCELIPCKREDLKVGDTAFAYLNSSFSNLAGYCKILDRSKVVYTDRGRGIVVADWEETRHKWYKVVPIKE